MAYLTHRFDPPLLPATLLRRYKRFLADVRLPDGREVVAHAANPGRMTGLIEPGSAVWLTPHDDPRRKLQWTWEIATDLDGTLVGVNPVLANRLVRAILEAEPPAPLDGYALVEREVRAGASRLDFRLTGHPDDPRPCWIEVKSVTLGLPSGRAAFPDAPSDRGRRHLAELAELAAAGDRAVILYLAQRADARTVVPAEEVDPAYAVALRAAIDAGVEALAWRAVPAPDGIVVDAVLPVVAG